MKLGRPKEKKANIDNLQRLALNLGSIIDCMPLVAYTMKECGCTYAEIAEVFGMSKQLAEYYVKQIREMIF